MLPEPCTHLPPSISIQPRMSRAYSTSIGRPPPPIPPPTKTKTNKPVSHPLLGLHNLLKGQEFDKSNHLTLPPPPPTPPKPKKHHQHQVLRAGDRVLHVRAGRLAHGAAHAQLPLDARARHHAGAREGGACARARACVRARVDVCPSFPPYPSPPPNPNTPPPPPSPTPTPPPPPPPQ